MKHVFRDNIPLDKLPPFTLRKAGILSGAGLFVSLCIMDVREKVGDILLGKSAQSESVLVTPNRTLEEAEKIAAGWNEASEDQVLKSYHVESSDTLFKVASKHGVTLESILKVNPKITSPDAIHVGQIVLIPYDGHETTTPETFQTTGSPIPLSFTKNTLLTMMEDILIKPKGKLLGAIGDQPSDAARLKVIAEKTGLGGNVVDVRYANLCAANMRAVISALQEYLENQGISIDLTWRNGKNGIGIGKYFSELERQGKLPRGFDVIQTKSNPDALKLKQLLLSKGKEYSIFVLSYSHDVDGHVNIAFRLGNDIIIFDPSWRGHAAGWPERFHKLEDYIKHFVEGEKTPGYTKASNRYNLFNVTCVPAHRITPRHSPLAQKKQMSTETAESDDADMKRLTMVFEGFTPRMKIDTQDKNKITYAIGYGTNVGTLQTEYPFASYGKDVAKYLAKKGYTRDVIREIMHCKQDISRSEARDLFEMRYIPRYQNMRILCGKKWNTYPPVIRNMLVDMSYNMGESAIFPHGKNPGFPDTVDALNRGNWVAYINAVVDSKYAGDVGARRLGKWIALVVRDVLKGKTAGLSQEALNLRSTYTVKHSKDLNSQMAKLD